MMTFIAAHQHDIKANNNLILHYAANVISISIDFPADNTVHPTKLSASDKTITISYHMHTASNTPTHTAAVQWFPGRGGLY